MVFSAPGGPRLDSSTAVNSHKAPPTRTRRPGSRYTANLKEHRFFRDRCAPLSAALAILFFLLGLPFVTQTGIQTDEAIFTSVLYEPFSPWFWISVFQKKIPLMVMSYMGTLKAALWAPLFQIFPPSPYSMRIPALFLAAATVWIFFFFTRRAANSRAALLATALLATDAAFLLSSVMDWGPVVLQHLLFLSGCTLLLAHAQAGGRWRLAGGFFLFGLGMWDKAVFIWTLSGMAVAVFALFPRRLWTLVSLRSLAVAAGSFCLGALPLIIYNIRRPLGTFRGNTVFSVENVGAKLNLLPVCLNGSVFFGWFAEEDWAVTQRAPRPGLESASVWLSNLTGGPRESLVWYGFLAAALLACLLLAAAALRRQPHIPWKTILLPVLFVAVTWPQMLFVHDAGGGAHHTLLMWPFPLFFMAVVFDAAASRLRRGGTALLAAAGVLLAGSNLLVVNHYLAQMIRNGAPTVWSDAIYALSDALPRHRASQIVLTDWGMLDNLRALHRGRLPLTVGSGPLMSGEPGEQDRKDMAALLAQPDSVFVSFTDDKQVFPQVNPRLARLASEAGYRRELLERVRDRNGRPVFEIFRFRRRAGATPPAPPG